MDEEKDILTDIFRNRLKDHEHPVEENDALWASIEEDLSKRKINSKWRRIKTIASVAAAFAALICAYLFLTDKKINDIDSPESTVVSNGQHPIQKAIENLEEVPSHTIVDIEKQTNVTNLATVNSPIVIGKEETISEPDKKQEIIVEESPKEEKIREDNQDIHPKNTGNQQKKDFFVPETSKESEKLYAFSNLKKKKQKNFSVSLLAGNTGTPSSSSNNKIYYYANMGLAESDLGNKFQEEYESKKIITDAQYDIPISAGIAVRKHLSESWSLESGLIYTYLSSTGNIKDGHNSMTLGKEKTELHYLGIPIKVVYDFHNTKRFSLYLTAGGMGEYCISGKITDEKKSVNPDIPELQWSVSASIGVNYNLSKHFGLFIEPGISYYFDDGNDINTIRDAMPLNYNFQGGIRLSY